MLTRTPHGGPLGCHATTAPGTGNCLSPVNVATTLRALDLQQGHCISSKRATRATNACADSYQRAAALTQQGAEQRFLQRQMAAVQSHLKMI